MFILKFRYGGKRKELITHEHELGKENLQEQEDRE